MKKNDIIMVVDGMAEGESCIFVLGSDSEKVRVRAAVRSMGMEVRPAAGKHALRVLKPRGVGNGMGQNTTCGKNMD